MNAALLTCTILAALVLWSDAEGVRRRKCQDSMDQSDVVECEEGETCETGYWGAICGHPGNCGYCKKLPACGENEHRVACGDTCGTTCLNYQDTHKMCTMECRVNACDCIEGYVRLRKGGPCVSKETCPVCGPNEHIPECGDTCGTTCANYKE